MGKRRGKGENTGDVLAGNLLQVFQGLTRDADALRVTMMIGHTGLYFEIRRADLPLKGFISDIETLQASDLNLPGGQNKNGAGVQLQAGADGRCSAGLGGGYWSWGQAAEFVEEIDVWDGDFGQQACFVHHRDGFARVVALCGLARQHDTVGTVKNSITNIADLGTCRTRVVGHGFQHLSCADCRLASHVALGNHHLLGDENLSRRNFNTKVSTGNHDTVSLFKDLVEVVDTLLILNLGNDLDVLACLAKNFTNVGDITGPTDERCKNHIHLVSDTKLEIILIFFGKRWEVDVCFGKIDTFLRRNFAIIHALDTKGLSIYHLQDFE